jgi:AcrR family transcriptional regulator
MTTTKEKILETSANLFNEKGCLNTSTRHIADALGISVGNLYYHFKNKEEILITIFFEYMNIIFKEVKLLDLQKDEIFLLKNFLIDNLESDVKYRFLHLELNLLLITFPKFKLIMEEQLQNEIKMIKELLNHQIKYGYIKQMSEIEIDFLVSNSWILATTNLTYWNLLSSNIIENVKKSALNMYYLIKPYLTQKSLDNPDVKEIEIILLKDYNEK